MEEVSRVGGFLRHTKGMKTLGLIWVLGCPGVVSAGVLYSGVGLPTSQGWTYGTHAPGALVPTPWGGAAQTELSPGVRLDTTADRGGYAGYFRQLPGGTLDRSGGFAVDFSVAVVSETNVGTPRAGFSVLVLTSDAKGIEIGFNNHQVFAQNGDFATFGESATWDPSALTAYRLVVSGEGYTLLAGGTPLLSGLLRSYTPGLSPFAAVYQQQDLLFLGDNTSQAMGIVELASVSVIPEPGVLPVLVMAGGLLGRRKR